MYNDVNVYVTQGNALSNVPAQIKISGSNKDIIYTATIVQEKGTNGQLESVIKFTKNES